MLTKRMETHKKVVTNYNEIAEFAILHGVTNASKTFGISNGAVHHAFFLAGKIDRVSPYYMNVFASIKKPDNGKLKVDKMYFHLKGKTEEQLGRDFNIALHALYDDRDMLENQVNMLIEQHNEDIALINSLKSENCQLKLQIDYSKKEKESELYRRAIRVGVINGD